LVNKAVESTESIVYCMASACIFQH